MADILDIWPETLASFIILKSKNKGIVSFDNNGEIKGNQFS